LAGPVPDGDFYAILSRQQRRPKAEVYAWTLRQPLPRIPVPLKPEDGDVTLDLHQAFCVVYDRARYDRSLDYTAPLPPDDAAWVQDVLLAAAKGGK
jgi:hypothetical protein